MSAMSAVYPHYVPTIVECPSALSSLRRADERTNQDADKPIAPRGAFSWTRARVRARGIQ